MVGLPDGRIPVLLSSHAQELIAADARRILDFLDREPSVAAVAATLLRLRRRQRHRAVVRAADLSELADGLRALADGDDHPLVARSSESDAHRRAFVFPGQGNQWPGMGAEAYRALDVYRAEADACAAAFLGVGAPSPLSYLTAPPDDRQWSQVEAQAAQFTHATALAAVWRRSGIVADLTVGHSLGEVAAAYVAGAVTLTDAAAVVVARATVLQELSQGYGMVVLGVGPDQAQQLIASIPGWLELAVVNAESSVAVSGEHEAVAALMAEANARGVFARTVTMAFPAHTSLLDGLRDQLVELLPTSEFRQTDIPFIGSATGTVVPPETDFADYWFANLRNTVRFDRAAASAVQHGANLFVEMSAHPALLFALGQSAGDAVTVGSGRRDESIVETLAAGVTAVAAGDPAFCWTDTVDATAPALRGFPNAPMRDVHLWALPSPLPAPPLLTVAEHRWQPHQPAAAGLALRRTGVLDLAGPTSGLGERLREAVQRHPGMQSAPADDADLVLVVAPALDTRDPRQAVAELTELIGAGLLNYADTVGPECRDVWLVTTAAEQVDGDPDPMLPAQAALAAMHRSIGFEYPDRAFRHLDLPSPSLDDAMAAAAFDAVLGGGDHLSLRESGGMPTLFARTEHEAVTTAESWVTDPGVLDNVVITGGNGTVGQHYARHLAERGAHRILLLSRSGELPDALAGFPVQAVRCDLTDPEQIAAAAAEFADDGASLVIHSAAVARFADHHELTDRDFADTAAAKIDGLARFASHWPLRRDVRMVLCSSLSGLWGGRGHAAYAGVNRILDAMAAQLRADGTRCVAVRFGLFGTGVVDRDAVAQIGRSGLVPLNADDAIDASLRDHPGDPLIYSADRERLKVFSEAPAADSPQPQAHTTDITTLVVTELTSVLGVDAGAVDLTASLLDMGVDSLLALDLRKRIRRATGKSVPLAKMLGGMTGTELIAGLDDQPLRNEISA
ncbi:mycobactin polyketide synthase MbtD [Mycobacterium sp. SMC-4]|uniref:mycobactin polyketide synthase MbtD n=1 Tax=Mycobacterium sp. SMC-4 TaxID=2857059 RepID=UPI003D08BC2E